MIQKLINEWGGVRSIVSSNRPKAESILYSLRAVFCFMFKRPKINYLGDDFYYLDKNTPILLQWYPEEIENLLKNTGKIKSCLDIGANIGQFAYVLKKYIPDIEIVSIEPQKEAVEIMKKNVRCKIIEACIGKGKEKTLYVEEGKNDRSSPVEGVNIGANKKIKVRSIELTKEMCKKIGIGIKYDLIKIDVEGGENEVLECIKELNWKFLQVESTEERIKITDKIIKRLWPRSQIIYRNNVTSNSGVINYVYHIG